MVSYFKQHFERLKIKFPGSESIEKNYSQSFQDMFVLSVLNGKKNGFFFEIGAHDPEDLSNTYLLEKFDWTGISIDIDPRFEKPFLSKRKSKFLVKNALTCDYKELFKEYNVPSQVDYLQIDIEPQINTFNCLKMIPLDDYRFSVITFETDYYAKNIDRDIAEMVRTESRKILESHGYLMVAGDVCTLGNDPFEDWWVDPRVVDLDFVNKIKQSESFNDRSEKIILENI